MAILIPEVVIRGILKSSFKRVYDDLIAMEQAATVPSSILYDWFGEDDRYEFLGDGKLRFDDMLYFDQIRVILKGFYDTGKTQRRLEMNLGWDANRKNFPVISIILPGEESSPGIAATTGDVRNTGDGANQFRLVNQNWYTTTYDLLITSDNANEVILLYNFVKTLILASIEQFEFRGLNNLKISGAEIHPASDPTPGIHHRTVRLNFTYCDSVVSLFRNTIGVGAFNNAGGPI